MGSCLTDCKWHNDRTREEILAAQIFHIPILRSLILSYSNKSTLARCSALSREVHRDAVEWLYREVDDHTDLHLSRSFCDVHRWTTYHRAVRHLRCIKPKSSWTSWIAHLDRAERIAAWYPQLETVQLGVSIPSQSGEEEAWLTLRRPNYSELTTWIVEACRLSSLSAAQLVLPWDTDEISWKWACRRILVGPEHLPSREGSRNPPNQAEPTAEEMTLFEQLDLTSVHELRLSGFCMDGEDLLRLAIKTPRLQRLEFYGGSTEIQEPLGHLSEFDYTNGLFAAKLTKQCLELKELTWHQCTEHPCDAFVLGCVQAGLAGLETLCVPWYDMLSSTGTAESRQNSARWLHTLSSSGVPWKPAHGNLRKVRLEMHPEDARLSNPFDLAVCLLLDFEIDCTVELGFRPSRNHPDMKGSRTDTGPARALSGLEAHNLAILKSALEIRQILITSMPSRPVGFSHSPRIERNQAEATCDGWRMNF